MREKKHEAGLEAWHTLVGAQAAVLEALERELGSCGAEPLASLEALIALSEAPDGRLRMQDLAGHLRLSRSGATRLVDRLVEDGLIRRGTCSEDRRGVHAELTEEGRRALRRSRPHILDAVEEHFSRHLTEKETELVRAALEKVLRGNGHEPHLFAVGKD